MAKKEKEKKVKRRFFYYSLTGRYLDLSDNTLKSCDNMAFTMKKALKNINDLTYSDKDFSKTSLLHRNGDGNYIYIKIDSVSKKSIMFRLLLCRDNLLPFIEENGDLTPLSDMITRNQKMAEITHCVLFMDKAVLAMEFNFAGAKTKDLAEYLTAKSNSTLLKEIEIPNLVNGNSLKKLKGDEELFLLQMKVAANSEAIKELLAEDDAFKALDCKRRNIDSVELVLRRRPGKKRSGFIIPCINADFIGRIFKKYKTDFGNVKVKYGYGTETIDLLAENYVCKADFVPVKKTKTIDKDEAYDVMDSYYKREVKNDL